MFMQQLRKAWISANSTRRETHTVEWNILHNVYLNYTYINGVVKALVMYTYIEPIYSDGRYNACDKNPYTNAIM